MTAFLLPANLIALALLLRFGGRQDRLGAVVFTGALIITPFVDHILWGSWKAGAACVDALMLIGFWTLAERYDRWWLVMAAGFQLIAVITFVIPWFQPGAYFIWTGVTLRIGVWLLLSITLFIGAWEAWAAQRFAREATNDPTNFRRSRAALATSERR
ncbi:hypothetical protein [Brevundimonas sp.]|uniref:hypothetical protein n=1 Tax=Brevundimonas sp. TaxID=1871086 RepID=UPI001D96DF46|nr:hypothetical protein [Brevundimonas sp.]MBA3999165.1 hypothetical protein [Brevundimonas sp.]